MDRGEQQGPVSGTEEVFLLRVPPEVAAEWYAVEDENKRRVARDQVPHDFPEDTSMTPVELGPDGVSFLSLGKFLVLAC